MYYWYQVFECGCQIQVINKGLCYYVGGEGNIIIVIVQDICVSCDVGYVDFSYVVWDVLIDGSLFGQVDFEW